MVERACYHRSDTVRGWGCFIIGAQDMSLRERLAAIRPSPTIRISAFADGHELAVRSAIAERLDDAFKTLVDWAVDPSDRIRRFPSEATRRRVCLVQTYRGTQGQS